jgi:flagellar protein FlbD
MIAVHRLTHPEREVYLNADLIQTVEATPDTVITLTNGDKLLVIESPPEVAELVYSFRAEILTRAGH